MRREVAVVLDGEVGDAARRVQHARLDERVRGAGLEAAATRAAPIRCEGEIGSERGIGEDDADEGERAQRRVDEHHVLADPAEARPLGQLALGDGPCVHVAARLRSGRNLTDLPGEPLQSAAEHAMIVGGLGVLGDARLTPGRRPGVMEIVGERDDRDFGPRHDPSRLLPLGRLAVQVRHRAGVARGQPAVEFGGVRVRLERSHSDGVEPHLERTTLQLDGLACCLRRMPARDFVRGHTCIVSRRQRANRTTSSTGGTAASSPYAVSMRQRR